MEDLRRNQAQTDSDCYLKYVIIHVKNLEDGNFAEDDISQHCLVSPHHLN